MIHSAKRQYGEYGEYGECGEYQLLDQFDLSKNYNLSKKQKQWDNNIINNTIKDVFGINKRKNIDNVIDPVNYPVDNNIKRLKKNPIDNSIKIYNHSIYNNHYVIGKKIKEKNIYINGEYVIYHLINILSIELDENYFVTVFDDNNINIINNYHSPVYLTNIFIYVNQCDQSVVHQDIETVQNIETITDCYIYFNIDHSNPIKKEINNINTFENIIKKSIKDSMKSDVMNIIEYFQINIEMNIVYSLYELWIKITKFINPHKFETCDIFTNVIYQLFDCLPSDKLNKYIEHYYKYPDDHIQEFVKFCGFLNQ